MTQSVSTQAVLPLPPTPESLQEKALNMRPTTAWALFRRNRAAMFGLIVLILIVLMTVIGPFIYTQDPFASVGARFQPPGSPGAPLGSDYLGRDGLAGIIHGGMTTLLVGLFAAVMTLLIGVGIGAVAGYVGGRVDSALMSFTELFQVIPATLFAMVVLTLYGSSNVAVAIVMACVLWTGTARLARSEFLRLKNFEFIRAQRSLGASDLRIIIRTVLPNALPTLMINATMIVGVAILLQAALSFLGLADPNVFTWGMMIGNSRPYLTVAWWTITFPGVAIFLTVLSVSLVGDGLQDAWNPKLKERR